VVARIALVDHLYADAIARPRTVFLLMTVFAVVGLTLAMAGVYGVLSHLVTQRLREIGIRLALGARPGDVGRAVVGSGIGLGALGLVSGLGLAFALVRVVRALLYDVNPSDPLSLGLVAAVLAVTSIAASWIPARRAMRVDPVALLRED
jgi:ABC-type antimicrobial peptide transport system permease subunit